LKERKRVEDEAFKIIDQANDYRMELEEKVQKVNTEKEELDIKNDILSNSIGQYEKQISQLSKDKIDQIKHNQDIQNQLEEKLKYKENELQGKINLEENIYKSELDKNTNEIRILDEENKKIKKRIR